MLVAGWQVPFPSQVRPEVNVVLAVGQDGGAHEVPPAYRRQAPLPLQKPSYEQLVLPMSWQVPWGSGEPLATLLQVPSEAASPHDWQAPWQAVPQQKPWAQNPERHSAGPPQVCPFPLSPHEPPMQTAGEAQSVSTVQAFLQTFVPHWYGKQGVAFGFTQVPAPLQVEPAVKVVDPAGQVEPAHGVP
jgi:hypothetical protein